MKNEAAEKHQPATSPARLRAARIAAGLSREQASLEIGVGYSAVQGYETGRSDPSLRVLAAMCRVYGVRADDLLGPASAR